MPDRKPDRKPVAKNRPRRAAGGFALLLWLVAFLVVFGAGAGTGWYLKGLRKPAVVMAQPPVKKEEPAPAAAAPAAPEAPLTFYKTLPAGGKAVMGTGLNLKKGEPASAARELQPAPAAAPPNPATPAPDATQAPAGAAAAPAASQAKQDSGSRYVVQLASYRDKQEALQAQAKLNEKGAAAYLVESKLPDKGVWFRLRIGRHLSRAEAGELATRYGKGAAILPE
jgi:cell division septation protein DedD